MKRTLLAIGFGIGLMAAGVAGAATPDDFQAPRHDEVQAPRDRSGETRAPRSGGDEVQAPRGPSTRG